MAKKQNQEEQLDLEDKINKKAEDTDGAEEVVVIEDKPKATEKPEVDDAVENRLKEMEARIAAADVARKVEKERGDRLEKERNEATVKTQTYQNDAVTAKERELESAKIAVDSNIKSLEDLYEKALEAGDSKQLREVNTLLQKAIVKQDRLESDTAQFVNYKKQAEEQAKQPKPIQLPPSVQDWINKNPKYQSDSTFKTEADSAHDAAIRYGYAFGSPAYLEFLDKRIEKIFGKEDDGVEEVIEEKPKPKREASYSAPPSRGGGDGGGNSGKKVYKLTAEEREAASFMNMTDLQYAQFKEKEKERSAR